MESEVARLREELAKRSKEIEDLKRQLGEKVRIMLRNKYDQAVSHFIQSGFICGFINHKCTYYRSARGKSVSGAGVYRNRPPAKGGRA